MTTIRKQMLEISRLSEESDGIYHDIHRVTDFLTVCIGYCIFCTIMTNRFLRWISAASGHIPSKRSTALLLR